MINIFIKRPVLAIVINLLMILAGVSAMFFLPLREYPDVENPVVSVVTTYIGASPETVESTITQPLEESLNGLSGIRSIKSKSAFGQSSIEVEFEAKIDVDLASTDVTNAIQKVTDKLPRDSERPIITKSIANSDTIMWLSLQGKNYTAEELSDIADRLLKPQLQVLPGISQVIIGGQRKYAMRIWLDPKKMAARKVDINDVRNALSGNNLLLPGGKIKGNTRQFNIFLEGIISNPRFYENIVVKSDGKAPVYIKDLGYVRLGSQDYDSIARYQNEQIVGVGIVRQSKANELKVADLVKKTYPKIQASLPKDLDMKIVVDRSLYIKAALKEVFSSLFLAFILVIIVTIIFLRSFTSTSIITFAIPVSLIGACSGMYFLGFSINVLTMFGMILAIGIVVDDAIVVLENIYRRQEEGEDKLQAAINGTKEVAFPVFATTLSLIAVFIPLSFLSGTTGKLFKEFSIVVALATGLSLIVSLTLTPALCSLFLKYNKKHNTIFNILESIFSFLENLYLNILGFCLRFKYLIVLFLIANAVISVVLYTFLPKTFVPNEDRGYFVTIVKAPQGSTLAYTSHIQEAVEKEISSIPEVTRYFSAIGLSIGGPANPANGLIFASLKHWDDRKIKQQDIVAKLFGKFSNIPGALIFPINPSSLGQSAFKKDIEFVIKSSTGLNDLSYAGKNILNRMKQIPGLFNVDSDLLIDSPQLDIEFHRKAIFDYGLTVEDVSKILLSSFSESKVNSFILRNKQYDVITSLVPRSKSAPTSINEIYIKGEHSNMIPLSNLVKIKQRIAPSELNHYDLQRSITISASLLPFLPLQKAIDEINKIAKEELSAGFFTTFSGVTKEYLESSGSLNIVFIISLIFIYLILAGTFESFIQPVVIMLSVPLALLGAFLTLKGLGQSINIYSQIGIILLLGLVAKNAILIVDYANQRLLSGKDLLCSVIEAARIRFRPIIMTSITTICGTLPLVFATGAGAESRQALGTVIVGGLAFSTVFTLFVIPVVYLIIVGMFGKKRTT